ncbi:hypothetical protein SCP_0301350 [Sparassis crispa]|uniref:DUF6729 domain-containing protein n=1 Tax=Sparassis crispa TaxID=139825 RepID=A0A401GE21_9APHY|nr:hypothetical protein SCP_0301350 [Sparassis crispa]GBE80420.1 hypothetical protein SCP_0301350 [Sparassis crispa]
MHGVMEKKNALSKAKCPVGRPKGSKNKPNAGTKGNLVGRPRKDREAGASLCSEQRSVTGSTAELRECEENSLSRNVRGMRLSDDVRNSQVATQIENIVVIDAAGKNNDEHYTSVQQTMDADMPGDSVSGDDSVSHEQCPRFSLFAGFQLVEDVQPEFSYSVPDDDPASFLPFDSHSEDEAQDNFDDFCEDLRPAPDDEETASGSSDGVVPEDHASASVSTDDMRKQTRIPRSSIPTWLAKLYADTCEQLRNEMRKNVSRRPSCYDTGSFMMGQKAPIFALAKVFQLRPAMFYEPQFFVWLPHLFVKIVCPACKAAGHRRPNGDMITLRLSLWMQSPHHIVDIKYNIYVIGYRYYCGHAECRKAYQSWSPAILQMLPPVLASQFHFHLTYRAGLTDRLTAILRASFQRGLGPHPFTEMIRTFHVCYYERLYIQYLELVKLRLNSTISSLLLLHERFGA